MQHASLQRENDTLAVTVMTSQLR